MITQAIRGWLHKVFAWWPWKQSTPIEYQHVASAVSSGPEAETSLWASKEGTVPQAGVTPRRFTLESRAERRVQPRSEAPDMPPLSPVVFLNAGADSAGDSEQNAPDAPTERQRLEFLRYLVQHGFVNEGFENSPPDLSS